MSVTSIEKDPAALTMTVRASFGATIQRVWQLWADPRQLERWWGPPTYPATVTQHELVPGGRVRYFMTGPEGDRHGGYWRVHEVVAPHRLAFEDGFEDDQGAPNPEMPVSKTEVVLGDLADGGTSMVVTTTFASTEAMERLLAMGMEEGMREAMGQIDALLDA
jgi:uncharacterized protein YndB with AHSA1/START domain